MSGLFSLRGVGRCSAVLMAAVIISGLVANHSAAQAQSGMALTLGSVLYAVKKNDFRLKILNEEAKAFLAESEAASYLPDPTVFAAIQSLPTDTFDVDQEPMTQLRVGLRQMFPKGDSLDIKSGMSGTQSDMQRIAGQLRWLTRKKQSEQAWLEAWYWQKNLALLEHDQVFLAQVQGFIQSLYEVGAKDQSDLIGANLELIKLNEKRIEASRRYLLFRQQLNTLANERLKGERVSQGLPDLNRRALQEFAQGGSELYLVSHPRIGLLDQKIALAKKREDLADQDFKPAWGLEVSYGLRDGENANGSQRPDFFSAGVNLEIPFFSDGKQRQNQIAAGQRSNAALIKRDEALSEMRFEIESVIEQVRHTDEQVALYEREILPTLETQRKSALQSYESDKVNFDTVISMFLKEQRAKTMYQRLRVNAQKLISSLNFLVGLDHGADEQ